MSCKKCAFFTGEDFLPCAVDPVTATSSPEEGCRDWQQKEEVKYTETEEFYHKPVFWLVVAITYLLVLVGAAYEYNNAKPTNYLQQQQVVK